MRLDFAFGKTGLLADLPDGFSYRILEARSARSLPDAAAALEAAMDAPAGCPPLEELARGKRTAAISVCDITRPAPHQQVLPPLLAVVVSMLSLPGIVLPVRRVSRITGPRSVRSATPRVCAWRHFGARWMPG